MPESEFTKKPLYIPHLLRAFCSLNTGITAVLHEVVKDRRHVSRRNHFILLRKGPPHNFDYILYKPTNIFQRSQFLYRLNKIITWSNFLFFLLLPYICFVIRKIMLLFLVYKDILIFIFHTSNTVSSFFIFLLFITQIIGNKIQENKNHTCICLQE